MISESQTSFETVKRCKKISPSVPRTLANSARESERKSRHGLNVLTVPSQMQSSPGKEVTTFILDSVLPHFFLVTSLRYIIATSELQEFSKGDKFPSEWATFQCLSNCRKSWGRRCSTPGIFVGTFHFWLFNLSLFFIIDFHQKRNNMRDRNCWLSIVYIIWCTRTRICSLGGIELATTCFWLK